MVDEKNGNLRDGSPRKPHGVRYPWGRWFERKLFTLVRGRDYRGQTHGMAQQVRDRAGRLGYAVSLEVDGDRIRVEVRGKRKPCLA